MTEPKASSLSLRLPNSLIAELDRAARDLRTTRSHIARLAIEAYLCDEAPKKRRLRQRKENERE